MSLSQSMSIIAFTTKFIYICRFLNVGKPANKSALTLFILQLDEFAFLLFFPFCVKRLSSETRQKNREQKLSADPEDVELKKSSSVIFWVKFWWQKLWRSESSCFCRRPQTNRDFFNIFYFSWTVLKLPDRKRWIDVNKSTAVTSIRIPAQRVVITAEGEEHSWLQQGELTRE